jgi:hypothetical protein
MGNGLVVLALSVAETTYYRYIKLWLLQKRAKRFPAVGGFGKGISPRQSIQKCYVFAQFAGMRSCGSKYSVFTRLIFIHEYYFQRPQNSHWHACYRWHGGARRAISC